MVGFAGDQHADRIGVLVAVGVTPELQSPHLHIGGIVDLQSAAFSAIDYRIGSRVIDQANPCVVAAPESHGEPLVGTVHYPQRVASGQLGTGKLE